MTNAASEQDCSPYPWGEKAGRMVDVLGTRIHLADQGKGPAVLLLHGWGRSYQSWSPIFSVLAARCRVIAPDLPGHGYSAPGQAPITSYKHLAKLLLALMDAEGIERATVIGNGLGGAIAMQLALLEPDRVDLLLLLSPLGYRLPWSWLDRSLASRSLVGRMLWGLKGAKGIAKWVARHAGPSVTHEQILEELRPALDSPRGLHDTLRACLEDLAWQVDELIAPTLVICGTADSLMPASLGRDLADAVAEGQFEAVVGAGHFVHEEAPDDFLPIITRFIALREGGAGPDDFSLVVQG